MNGYYQQLNLEERIRIEMGLQQGLSPAAIAAGLNRPRSCISRELARNGWRRPQAGRRSRADGGYRAGRAQKRAQTLKQRALRPHKMTPGNALWEQVVGGLRQGYSPEQIAGMLKRMDAPERLCHETIYQALYLLPRGELRRELIASLRLASSTRRPRSAGQDRRGPIANKILIDERPADIDLRLVPGHWEGDLIKGKGNQSQVGTLVERQTRYVALVRLKDASAHSASLGFSSILKRFDAALRLSMTYDQGPEMAHHAKLTQQTGVTVYFAHPHSPWERGLNENTNGLLRQYLPKGTDLSTFSQKQLDDIAWLLNTRPRKSLGWRAPAELFLPPGSFDTIKHCRKIFGFD